MIAAVSLVALSATSVYALGRSRRTAGPGVDLVPSMGRGVKTLADTGANMRPIEQLRT